MRMHSTVGTVHDMTKVMAKRSIDRGRAAERYIERLSKIIWPWHEGWLVPIVALLAALDYISTYFLLEFSGRADVYEGGLLAGWALHRGGFDGLYIMNAVAVGFGHELCRTLKQDPATAHVKVVILTGLSEESERQKALEIGADEFLTKPFSPIHLLETLESICSQRDVSEQIQGYGDERTGAQATGQVLATTMRVKKGLAAARVEAPPEAAPPHTPIDDAAPTPTGAVAKEGEAEVIAQAEGGRGHRRVRHPDGSGLRIPSQSPLRLTELEQELGLNRFHAARIVRHLMEEGKTEKQGLSYFAI